MLKKDCMKYMNAKQNLVAWQDVQSRWNFVLLLVLVSILSMTTSCSDDNTPILEGLCGATYEEMVADYLITYDNYYHITPEKDPDICNALVSLRLNPCLMHYAGVSDESQLPNIDYSQAFSDYLLSHGMNQQQVNALVQALTTP